MEQAKTIEDYLSKPAPQKRTLIKPVTDNHNWKQRYHEAHKLNFQRSYPSAWKDGHYAPLKSINLPDVTTSNGLNRFMVNYINWSGYNAARVNVVARVTDKVVTEASGAQFTEKRYTKSSRRGKADVQSTIKGRSCQFEGKIGRDIPSKFQLEEQRKEWAAGGMYEFISSTDDFFDIFDPLVYG